MTTAEETVCPSAGEPPPTTSVRADARRAFGWSLFNSVAGRFVTVFVGLVLARLLAPDEYGTFAVAIVVLAVLQSMNELGVSVAVVRWQGEIRRAARTATTLAMATSSLLYLLVFFGAPIVAEGIGSPGSVTVIRILAVGVLIDGVSSIPGALMARAFQQRRRAIADLVALVPSSTVSIVLAANGHGAVSLAWGALAGNVTATVLVLALAPARPLPGWNHDDAAALLRVGLPLAGTSLVLLATLNVDYVIVGRLLGTTALGLYLLAFNLSSWPSNLLSIAVRRVAIPGFAKIAGDGLALEQAFTRSVRMLAVFGFLLATPLAALAWPAVGLVYGERWQPAAPALAALAVLGGFRILFDLAYDLLAGVGRTRSLLAVQLAWFAGLLVALPIGATVGGIGGVGVAHLVVAVGLVGPLYLAAIARAGIAVRAVLAALAPAAYGAAGCAVVIFAGRQLGWTGWFEMLCLGAAGAGAYVLVVVGHPSGRGVVRDLVPRRASVDPSDQLDQLGEASGSFVPAVLLGE